MRKRDRKALVSYVRTTADAVGLRDWNIVVNDDYLPRDDSRAAVCSPIFGRKLAHIQFRETVRDEPTSEVRNTVVHELIHCHLAALQSQIECDLEKVLGAQADRVFFDSFRRNLEYGVDGLAGALDPHFPLIDWPA